MTTNTKTYKPAPANLTKRLNKLVEAAPKRETEAQRCRRKMDAVHKETGQLASGDRRFKVGDRLIVTGPFAFPFKMTVIVTSATRTDKKMRAYTRTGIAPTAETPRRLRAQLLGYIDTNVFDVEFPTYNFPHDIEGVTVRKVAMPLGGGQ